MIGSGLDVTHMCFSHTFLLCIIYRTHRINYRLYKIICIRIFRIIEHNLPVTVCYHALQPPEESDKEMLTLGFLEMSALSCIGMRWQHCGETVLLFKIEISKEARLIYEKFLNIQFFWRQKKEKKKSFFISEAERGIAGTKNPVSCSAKLSSQAWH